MDENPYASPAAVDEAGASVALSDDKRRRIHARRLRIPAILLRIYFIVFGIYDVFVLAGLVVTMALEPSHTTNNFATSAGLFVVYAIALLIHASSLRVAWRMLPLGNCTSTRLAALAAMIPLPSLCVLGIPIGVWALVVLLFAPEGGALLKGESSTPGDPPTQQE